MNYPCPVCGYPKLVAPPQDYLICPSCGTEFGYDDFAASHEELRRAWIAAGAPWFSRSTPPPLNWNPVDQLLRAGLLHTELASEISESEVVLSVQGRAFTLSLKWLQDGIEFSGKIIGVGTSNTTQTHVKERIVGV